MSDALPEQEATRFVDLDEGGLRARFDDWTTGATDVIVPVKTLDGLVRKLDSETARADVYAASLAQWGPALVDLARDLGVDTDMQDPAAIAAACRAAVAVLKTSNTELRKSQLVLDTMTRWRLR